MIKFLFFAAIPDQHTKGHWRLWTPAQVEKVLARYAGPYPGPNFPLDAFPRPWGAFLNLSGLKA